MVTKTFAQELVQLFIDSGDAALLQIRAALDRGDLAAIGAAAHSFKGSSANIHARSASPAAGRLEAGRWLIERLTQCSSKKSPQSATMFGS